MSVFINYQPAVGSSGLFQALLTFNLKQPNNYRKYLSGRAPQSDSEAIYSDWAKVGNDLKQAGQHIAD
jgi:hypothetical protein